VFYTLAARASAPEAVESYVLKIDLAAAASTIVHRFPATSSGCCGLFADPGTGHFYVGDTASDGRGTMAIYDAGAALVQNLALSGNPYTGALIPK
jgi:hypothetical protein